MRALNWIVLALALFQGGWLCFDGSHALLLGDYVTPRSGPGAGQLGPWARLVSAVGLDPRSTTIKCLHLFLGIAWLLADWDGREHRCRRVIIEPQVCRLKG